MSVVRGNVGRAARRVGDVVWGLVGARVGFSVTPLGRDDSINGVDLKGG